MVVRTGNFDWNDSWPSSCQNRTIFNRFGPEPTCFDTNDTMGRTLMTRFTTLKGLRAFIAQSFVPVRAQ